MAGISDDAKNRVIESNNLNDRRKAYEEAKQKSPNTALSTEGRAYHRDDTTWKKIPIPGSGSPVIKDIFIETPDKIWMVGGARHDPCWEWT